MHKSKYNSSFWYIVIPTSRLSTPVYLPQGDTEVSAHTRHPVHHNNIVDTDIFIFSMLVDTLDTDTTRGRGGAAKAKEDHSVVPLAPAGGSTDLKNIYFPETANYAMM